MLINCPITAIIKISLITQTTDAETHETDANDLAHTSMHINASNWSTSI